MWLAYHFINRAFGISYVDSLPGDYIMARSRRGETTGPGLAAKKKLAASVNILPQMDSIYRWKGEIRHGREHKILIKTSAARIATLEHEIRAAHPYAVAEILHFEIDSGNFDYLDWITQSTQ